MKKIIVAVIIVLLGLFLYNRYHIEQPVAYLNSEKDPTPPDPNRPYFDALGNKYDYQGNLISPAPEPMVFTDLKGK